jgi:hypothetical protein
LKKRTKKEIFLSALNKKLPKVGNVGKEKGPIFGQLGDFRQQVSHSLNFKSFKK